MRGIWMASLALALMSVAGMAQANPCTGTNITNCNAGTNQNINTNTQQQSQTLNNSNKAYGGGGGAGGQGGAGGSASATGGNASATGGAANANSTNTNSNQANNEGNSQNVNFNDRLQAPAVSSFIAASGPCTGVSGGGAVSVAGFGFGASFASLEEDCKKRELLRIGFASGNQAVQGVAAQGWMTMYQAAFGSTNGTGQQQGSTSATPAAIAPQQTADASPAPYCNANWPTVIKIAHGCN